MPNIFFVMHLPEDNGNSEKEKMFPLPGLCPTVQLLHILYQRGVTIFQQYRTRQL